MPGPTLPAFPGLAPPGLHLPDLPPFGDAAGPRAFRPARPTPLPAGMKPHPEMVRLVAPEARLALACATAATAWLVPLAALFWLAA